MKILVASTKSQIPHEESQIVVLLELFKPLLVSYVDILEFEVVLLDELLVVYIYVDLLLLLFEQLITVIIANAETSTILNKLVVV